VFRLKLSSLMPRTFLIYLVVIAAAFALAHSRVRSASPEPKFPRLLLKRR
jgi:hypothetical protein